MGTDFFDDDLTRPDDTRRESPEEAGEVPVLPITDASLSRMVRQKADLSNQVAGAMKEIGQLRMRQGALEKEKMSLEDLGRRQDEYEVGKRDIIEKLNRSLVLLEKEEIQATRVVELCSEVRRRFRDTLSELAKIKEEAWADENFEGELDRATTLVENARQVYRKALARIDATGWQRGGSGKTPLNEPQEMTWESSGERGFGFWLKVGLAMTLPLLAFLAALFAAWVWLSFGGLI